MNLRQTVIENDMRLMDVATYVATKGNTLKLKALDQDKLMALSDKVQDLFSEYKMRVRKGSFTVSKLEELEYSRYGITEEIPLMNNPLGGLFGNIPETKMVSKKDDESNPIDGFGFK